MTQTWTPDEYIYAMSSTFAWCVGIAIVGFTAFLFVTDVVPTITDYCRRLLIKWWTGEWPK